MTWPTVKVGDLVDQVRGVTYSSGDAIDESKDGYIELLRANNIDNGQLNFSNLIYVPKSKVSDKQYIKKNDIVIAASSGSLSVVGKAGALTDERQCTFGAFCKVLRPNSKVNARYIANYFQTRVYRQTISSLAEGANINNLRNEHIDNLLIVFPPLAEQKRIAAILDKAEEIKRKREQAITKLDELAQGTFVDMFGDFMKNSERIELKDLIAEFRYGTSNKSSDSGHPTLRIPNIAYGSLNLTELKTVVVTAEEFKRLQLTNGDLLFVRTNGNPEYVGRCVVFNPTDVEKYAYDSSSYIYASYLIRARLKTGVILPIILQEFLSTVEGKKALKARCKTSAGQFNINTEGLGSIPIPIFPTPLQERFTHIKKSIELQKSLCEKGLWEINRTINSLQHQAFTTGFSA